METAELIVKIARAKKRLNKMMEDLEKQSEIQVGYMDKLPEIYIHSGIGDISRLLDRFMVSEKSEVPEHPYIFRIDVEGIEFCTLVNEE